MKSSRIVIVLAGLAILSAAFLLIKFHAAVSNTQSENSFSSVSSGDRLPDAMQRKDPITLAVVGEGSMARALQNALSAQLHQAGLGDVELAQGPEVTLTTPVVLVEIGQPNLFWTPFYATGRFPVRAGYASDGDLAYLSGTSTFASNENGPVIHLSGDFQVNDTSWGIISRPGYDQILADALARQIVEALAKIYQGGI